LFFADELVELIVCETHK